MRLRWDHFCWAVIDLASENEGRVDDGVLIRAVRRAFQDPGMMESDNPIVEKQRASRALKKAHKLLTNPDVRRAIADVYEFRGFTLTDAVDKHLEHINGPVYYERNPETGELERMRGKPSYAALKDFLAMVLPKAPSRVDLKLSRGTDDDSGYTPPELPAMQSRVLSTKVE